MSIFNKYLKLSFLSFIILFFAACEKEISLDLPPADIRPVVYAMAQAGKPIDLIVYKSYPLLTYTDTLNKNIKTDISLFVNNQFQEILTYTNNHYYSRYLPKHQDILKIVFNWENKEISAESIIPNEIKIDSVKFIKKTYENIRVFKVYFADEAEFRNYYGITIACYAENDIISRNYYLPTTCNSPLIGDEEDLSDFYDYQSLLFSDALFNGTELNLAINIEDTYLNEDERLTDVKFYLTNISEDYYQYVKTYLKNQRAQNPDFSFGDLEYVNVHSNINNGYGFFKAFALDTVNITQSFQN